MPKKKDIRYFEVPGRPKAKQRPRLAYGRVITPKQTIEYEKKLRDCYMDAHGGKEPFTGDVAVDIYAFFRNHRTPDLDNIVKTLDGLNKVAWEDDKQIKEINARLVVDGSQEERLVVIIRPLDKNFKQKVEKKITSTALQTSGSTQIKEWP